MQSHKKLSVILQAAISQSAAVRENTSRKVQLLNFTAEANPNGGTTGDASQTPKHH